MKYFNSAILLLSFSLLLAEEVEQPEKLDLPQTSSNEDNISFGDELVYRIYDHPTPQASLNSNALNFPDQEKHNQVDQPLQNNSLQSENKPDLQVHEIMLSGGYSRLFGKYSGTCLGLTYRYNPSLWGIDISYLEISSRSSGFISQRMALTIPFIKISRNSINLYLGTGLGTSKNKFSHFLDYSVDYFRMLPSETYYSLDVAGLMQVDYFLNMRYLKSIGVIVRAIQPSYFLYHKGASKNFQPTYPSTIFGLLLGF